MKIMESKQPFRSPDPLDLAAMEIDTTLAGDSMVEDSNLSEAAMGDAFVGAGDCTGRESVVEETPMSQFPLGVGFTTDSRVEETPMSQIGFEVAFARESQIEEGLMSAGFGGGAGTGEGSSPAICSPMYVPKMLPIDESHLWPEYAEDNAVLEQILCVEKMLVILYHLMACW